MPELFRPEIYLKPKSLENALQLLKQYGEESRVLAGGTDLLVQKPAGVKCIIDLKGLPLDYIHGNPDGLNIGATTTFSHILESPLIHTSPYNVLTDSVQQLGHRNIRNLATIGGNICNAVPSADAPVALIALDAQAVIATEEGSTRLPLENFFKGVRKTSLRQGEFLREIFLPQQPGRVGAAFQKLSRTRVDIALVNVAVKVTLDDSGICSDARVVLGAVAPTPIRSREAENSLLGRVITDKVVIEASQYAREEAKPISDVRASAEYRREMTKVLTGRAIHEALKRAEEA